MAMTFGSSEEEGAIAATALEACLEVEVEEEDTMVNLPFFAVSASAAIKVLYPLPEGKPVGQSRDLCLT